MGASWGSRARQQAVFHSICDLVKEKFYREDEELASWFHTCKIEAARRPWMADRDDLAADIVRQLSQFGVSHLNLVAPFENRIIWNSEYRETGIRVRMVDGYYLVYELFPQSPAESAGLKVGDLIAALNGASLYHDWDIQFTGGWYDILRDKKHLRFFIETKNLVVDESPKWTHLASGLDYLRLPSFREDFFHGEKWDDIVRKIHTSRRLILDLRGNRGGNFVAMLRLLSQFHCQARVIGRLRQPRLRDGVSLMFTNDLAQQAQLAIVGQAREIVLKTFPQEDCFTGELTALVDGGTASVAEILAQALVEQKATRVLGRRTAGDVLLAVIYPVHQLGDDYSLHVPQMYYESAGGRSLEAEGVIPMEELDYTLSEAERGLDSWLLRAQGR